MGVALLRLNRLSEAETSLAAAAKSFDELGNATFRARVDLVRAQLLSNSGQRALARTLALKALANLHDRLPDAIAARLFLGRLSLEERKYDQADAELASGLADAQELDIAPLKAELLMTRGLLRRKQSRLGEAIGFFTAAIEQIERVRGSLQAERFRVGYHSEQTKAYEWLLMSLLELGGDAAQAQAFAVAEQAKSRSLLDQMRQTMEDVVDQPSAVHDSAESALWKKMSQLRADLNALYSRLDDDRAHKTSTPQSWRAAVKDRERDLDELESRLRTTRGMGGLYGPTTTIEHVQSSLDADSTLIEYFIAGDELLAFVVTKTGAQTFRGLANPSELASALQRLQFQVNRALRPQAVKGSRAQRLITDARHELNELYDLVWSPLRGATQHAKHLIVVPHGPLHVLPFHALWDGERYLIESHTIQYAPSASLLVHLSAQPRQAEFANSQTALVLGVADTNAPQIADEARVVGDALSNMRKKTLIGSDATVDAFCNAAPEADVIHLACHGRFAADTPMGSGLKLADRWLTVRDIYSLKLKASLVTLSGCETGVNLVTAGDELMGLLRGFFAAGAESLLVSLWRVDDAVTREFMSDFYRSLNTEAGSRRTKADIHAQTQRKFLARYQHPALWAPFILEGRE
jgi:CHAT domain-containing protein